ncbi:fluoride efflux transporter CrcB [Calidifontibacillus oryziterrae]|uniref:fluoride efflux transporter CrcB n=1 Tax=Calidifontibacillus oryziterrae TaxID=1191699 RepID=UPI0002F79309|nr:fluoride efflux transporter CrcB [Calidifontibacillus oryziterrae]
MNVILIAIGGFLGAISRFAVGEWLQTNDAFPLETFVVNIIGCFILGWFLAFAKREDMNNFATLFIGTGFLGSFTTFSTFSVEAIRLVINKQLLIAFLYSFTSITVGIGFAYLGYRLGKTNVAKGAA